MPHSGFFILLTGLVKNAARSKNQQPLLWVVGMRFDFADLLQVPVCMCEGAEIGIMNASPGTVKKSTEVVVSTTYKIDRLVAHFLYPGQRVGSCIQTHGNRKRERLCIVGGNMWFFFA